jgi:hypothetical protein
VGPRDLLTDHERTLLFEIPADDHELIRHYTLSRADQEFVLAKRGDRNKLGVALQLGLLRHPGFGWRPGAPIPETLIRFIALQLGIPTSVFKDYGHRSQTQTDHARELATWLGLRHSTHGDIPLMREAAADAAWSTDQGCVIARAIIDRLRDSGIILPDPSVIERAGISGRKKARRHRGGETAVIKGELAIKLMCPSLCPSNLTRIMQRFDGYGALGAALV